MTTSKTTTDRSDLLLAGLVSVLVNLGWLFMAPADGRIILVLVASVIAGLVGLIGENTGAYAMGIILGAMLAAVIGLALVASGLSPLAA